MSVKRQINDIMGSSSPKKEVPRIDKIPSIQKTDFNNLHDHSLEQYMAAIPNQEWRGIVKALLLGVSTAAISSLIHIMGRYTQWLKDNASKDKVKATDDSLSSRAGASVGKGVAKVINFIGEKDVLAPFKKKSKQVGDAIRAGLSAYANPKKKQESFYDRLKNLASSFKRFKREG